MQDATRSDLPPLPSATALRAYMRATGWTEGTHGSAGSVFTRDGFKIGVPHEDDDPDLTRGALVRLAAAADREPGDVARGIIAVYGPGPAQDVPAVTSPAPDPSGPPAASTAPSVPVSEAAVRDALAAVALFWKEAHAILQAYPSAQLARAMLEAAAPRIRAAERERLAAVISPEQFRSMADWFDADDEFKTTMFPETWPRRGHETQDDLRKFADLLGSGEEP